MLNKETEEQLKVLGFDVSKLTEAINSEEEVSLEVPKLYTDEQKNLFGKNRFDEGKNAMSEIIAKDVKKSFSIDVDTKDINKVVEAYGAMKVSELGKPNERINALEAEKTELQNKITSLSQASAEMEQNFNQKLFGLEVKTQLSTIIPENTTIAKEDISTLFLNTHTIERDENGKQIVKRDGVVLKDDLLNPIELKNIVGSFLDSKGFIKKSGMGGTDQPGGGSAKFTNMAEFEAHCKKNNIDQMSNEGLALLEANKADNFKY